MNTITGSIRSIGASSFRQANLGSASHTGPLRLRLRNLHNSPISRRAPVPNQTTPRPSGTLSSSATTNGTSTLGGSAANGGRANGSGAGAGAGAGGKKKPSAHALWYREIVPAMIPPLLLSLTIFLSLSLLRLHLSHQLSLSEQAAQIELLEQELERLRTQAIRRGEREKRERERMLPVVVGKVLQRVGVLNREREEDEEELREEERMLV